MIPTGHRRSFGRTTMSSSGPSTCDILKVFFLSIVWIFGIYNFTISSFTFLSSSSLKNSFSSLFYSPIHQVGLDPDYSACNQLTRDSENHTKCMLDIKNAYHDAQQKCTGYITTLSACKAGSIQGGKCRVEEANVVNCINAVTLDTKAKWKNELS